MRLALQHSLPWLARIAAVAGLALVALGGCQTYVAGGIGTCPQFLFLGGAERVTLFRAGSTRAPADVTYKAEMARLGSSCEMKPNVVRAHLVFDVDAARAPGPRTNLNLRYFIAVTTADGALVAKHAFIVSVPFFDQAATGTVTEKIQETIPLAAGQRANAFQIYVGFQVNDEELEYNLAGNR